MCTIVARTGRQRQRYENNFRLVSGCIPYRRVRNDEDSSSDLENSIEVLMISSPNRDDLVFPKGGWEDDETVEEAACREALEEAGVRGIIKGDSLGDWIFRSKSKEEICSLEGGCKVHMFALEVTEELEIWPEQENHDRKWLFIREAFQLCRYKWMSTALEKFLEVMATDKKHEMNKDIVLVEAHPPPLSEVVPDCTIMSTTCHPSFSNKKKTVFQAIIQAHILAYAYWYSASAL